MNKLFTLIALCVFSVVANAGDTTGYVKISDIKAFPTYLSVYLDDGQAHHCGATPSGRFQSDTTITHFTSLLLSAFAVGKGVNLKYICSGNTANITGVRLTSDS